MSAADRRSKCSDGCPFQLARRPPKLIEVAPDPASSLIQRCWLANFHVDVRTLDRLLFRTTLPRMHAHGAGSLVPLSTGASAESDERRSSRKPAFVWPTSIR